MIVDTHAHYLPQELLEDLNNRSTDFPSIECLNEDNTWKLGFAGGALTRPIMPKLRQGDTRLEWMDDQKIDVMVCGGWLDSFGYEIPDEEGMRWSKFINEHLLKACSATKRFAPLCSVPLQNGKMAANVLEEALASGFHGTCGCSHHRRAKLQTRNSCSGGNQESPSVHVGYNCRQNRVSQCWSIHPCWNSSPMDLPLLSP